MLSPFVSCLTCLKLSPDIPGSTLTWDQCTLACCCSWALHCQRRKVRVSLVCKDPQPTPSLPTPVPYFPWVPVLLLVNPWRGWLISSILESPIINISVLETICLLWKALVGCIGNHVRAEQTQNLNLRFPIHSWTVNEFSANNRKFSFGNTDFQK